MSLRHGVAVDHGLGLIPRVDGRAANGLDADFRLVAHACIFHTTISVTGGLWRLIAKFRCRFIEHALIMFSMLQVAFSQNTIPRSRRIARQGRIFFRDLKSIAANTNVGPVAVESLNPGIKSAAAIVVTTMMMVTATVTAAMAAIAPARAT